MCGGAEALNGEDDRAVREELILRGRFFCCYFGLARGNGIAESRKKPSTLHKVALNYILDIGDLLQIEELEIRKVNLLQKGQAHEIPY